jgi:hypothetical protein
MVRDRQSRELKKSDQNIGDIVLVLFIPEKALNRFVP